MRRHVERKKTRAELLELLIEKTAYALSTGDNSYTVTEFIASKNLSTLQAMVKSGILEFAPYSDNTVILSAKSRAKYQDEIRKRAVDSLAFDIARESQWHKESQHNAHLELYLRFCAVNVKKEYWTNTPEFQFIDWHFRDELDAPCRVNCCDHLNTYRHTEETIQDLERRQAYAELTTIPSVELCALR